MTLGEAAASIGARVEYRAHPGAEPERGVVESLSVMGTFVFVRFDGDQWSKATPAERLTLL